MGKVRRLGGSVVTTVLVFLALADAPEQLARWKRGWDSFVSTVGIDWAAFWSGDVGRWALLLIALAVGLWAWDVPSRVLRRHRGDGGESDRETAKRLVGHLDQIRTDTDEAQNRPEAVNKTKGFKLNESSVEVSADGSLDISDQDEAFDAQNKSNIKIDGAVKISNARDRNRQD